MNTGSDPSRVHRASSRSQIAPSTRPENTLGTLLSPEMNANPRFKHLICWLRVISDIREMFKQSQLFGFTDMERDAMFLTQAVCVAVCVTHLCASFRLRVSRCVCLQQICDHTCVSMAFFFIKGRGMGGIAIAMGTQVWQNQKVWLPW